LWRPGPFDGCEAAEFSLKGGLSEVLQRGGPQPPVALRIWSASHCCAGAFQRSCGFCLGMCGEVEHYSVSTVMREALEQLLAS
jgi:hypothetical protein